MHLDLKYRTLALLLALTALTAAAHVLDAPLRSQLKRSSATESRARVISQPNTHVPLILKIRSEEALDELREMNVTVWKRRGHLLLCSVPLTALEGIDNSNLFVSASSAAAVTTMDMARADIGIDRVETENPWGETFDGSGVVVGFADIGFDARHIAFRAPDGSLRVRRMIVYDGHRNRRLQMDTPEEILARRTDSGNEAHATHVAGIMSGSYQGNPYHGVAPGAEIVATMSQLYSACILAGMEDVVEYAHVVGQPAVINVSLADYQGPHDGSTLFNQWVSSLGREAIVCISSGNNGNRMVTKHDTVAPGQEMGTQVGWADCTVIDGSVDIWNADSTPLSLHLYLWDSTTGNIVSELPRVTTHDTTSSILFCSDTAEYGSDGYATVTGVTDMARLGIDGFIAVETEINSENHRSRLYVTASFTSPKERETDKNARYRLLMGLRRADDAPPARVDMYAAGNAEFWDADVAGRDFKRGNSEMSVNDLACGDNLVSVGMINNRNTYPRLAGEPFSSTFETGVPSPHSSYATLPDGRRLPHVVAPGNYIVSATSGAALEGGYEPDLVARAEVDGEEFFWHAMGGTSMASPLMAGVIASWLQADPRLKIGDVLRIIADNTRAPASRADSEPDPRWGMAEGPLDAYTAMLQVVQGSGRVTTGLHEINCPLSDITLSPDRLLRITAHSAPLTLNLYTPQVQLLMIRTGLGAPMIVSLDQMPRGIYILTLTHDGHTCARKVAL